MSLETRLRALVQALGVDYKALKAQADGLGSSSDPWMSQATTPFTNGSTTVSTPFGPGFITSPNTRYIVDVWMMARAVATSTGIQAALAGPLTADLPRAAAVKIISVPNAAPPELVFHTTLNTFQTATSAIIANHLIMIQAIIETGPGTPQTPVTVQIKAEEGPNTQYEVASGIMRWRAI